MATTVVITQNRGSSDWDHSLCGCFDDCGACLLAYCCPCIAFGMNAADSGACCDGCCGAFCGCLLFFVPCINLCLWCSIRSKIRSKHNIPQACCSDCCSILFCGCCALAQERQQCQKPTQSTNMVVINQPANAPPVQQQPGIPVGTITQQPGMPLPIGQHGAMAQQAPPPGPPYPYYPSQDPHQGYAVQPPPAPADDDKPPPYQD